MGTDRPPVMYTDNYPPGISIFPDLPNIYIFGPTYRED